MSGVSAVDRRVPALTLVSARLVAFIGGIVNKRRGSSSAQESSAALATGVKRLARLWGDSAQVDPADHNAGGASLSTIGLPNVESSSAQIPSLSPRAPFVSLPGLSAFPIAAPGREYQVPATAALHVASACARSGAYDMALDVFFNARHYIEMGGRRGPIHSHSFRLQARCQSSALDGNQCIAGFAEIKRVIEHVVAPFSNQLLNDMPVFSGLRPTSECLATVIAHLIEPNLHGLPVSLTSVTLWEAPSVSIMYTLARNEKPDGKEQQAPLVSP